MALATQCKDSKFSDENINKQARNIAEILDSSSIQIFHRWNYEARGERWMRISCGKTLYSCFYNKVKDTAYLRIYQPFNFSVNFPNTISFDTSRFWQINFDMFENKIFRIRLVDTIGQDRIIDTSVAVNKIFIDENPYDTLNALSEFKDKFGVYGIEYRSDLGEFVQFWLASGYKLTYLPDNLNLNPKVAERWLQDFAGGKMIRKNWNLHQYDDER